jgi:hypothetical protein
MLAIQKNKRAIINDALGGNKNSKAGQAQTLEDLKVSCAYIFDNKCNGKILLASC